MRRSDLENGALRIAFRIEKHIPVSSFNRTRLISLDIYDHKLPPFKEEEFWRAANVTHSQR